MAEVSVVLHPQHAVEVEATSVEFSQVSQNRPTRHIQVQNWEVNCATCAWRSPTHFRAKAAAVQTAKDHCDDVNDTGILWVTLLSDY